MRYVVAGGMLLAAMVIAGIALLIPLEEEQADESSSDAASAPEGRSPVAAIKSCVASSSWAHRGMILISSLLCAAVGWVTVGLNPEVWAYGKWCAAALMLLAAMMVDYRCHRIPNAVVLSGYAAGLLLLAVELVFQPENALRSLLAALIGASFCLVLLYLLARLTKEGVGMGDVKLLSVLGWLVGLVPALIALFLAMILCALAAVVLLLSKKKSRKDVLPLGPFLFLGYFILIIMYCI